MKIQISPGKIIAFTIVFGFFFYILGAIVILTLLGFMDYFTLSDGFVLMILGTMLLFAGFKRLRQLKKLIMTNCDQNEK